LSAEPESGGRGPGMGSEGPRLSRLAAPIVAENLVRTSLLAIDQLMLYAFATDAAAAMSASSQLGFFLQLLYQMPAQGASILIAQKLGAGRREEAESFALGGIVLVGLFSVAVSLAYASLAGPVLSLFSLEPEVHSLATSFLTIYGGLSVFMALNIAQAATLRAWGHSRDVMVANIAALVCTIGGNYLALFGPFGLPILGLRGVALSNVAGQLVAFAILSLAMRRRGIRPKWRNIGRLPRSVVRGILEIGLPTAGENISYNLSQVTITGIVSTLGTAPLAAYGLVLSIVRYVYMFGVSIGAAAQIRVGWLVGAGRPELAKSSMWRWLAAGATAAFALALSLNLFKGFLVPLFTTDPTIDGLVGSVFALSIVYEPGRSMNTVVIPGLKGAGDVRFPVLMGMIFNWSVAVTGAFVVGKLLGFGLVGVFAAMASDEWIRGLIILRRWHGGRWMRGLKARETPD